MIDDVDKDLVTAVPETRGALRQDGMPVGRPFVKGNSPNPGGKPKVLAELRALCREYTEDAIAGIVHLATTSENDQVRLGAWREILDRGYGRPVQPLTTESEAELSRLTSAELARRAEAAAARVRELEAKGDDGDGS